MRHRSRNIRRPSNAVRPRCIVLDFDNTIARAGASREWVWKPFGRWGVPRDRARAAYEAVRDTQGFSITKTIRRLQREGFRVPQKAAEQAFWLRFRRELRLYRDTQPFLRAVRARFHLPLMIVTYGDPVYQRAKVRLAGVRADRLILISTSDGKPAAIRKLLREFGAPLLVVDDKASELDRLRRNFSPREVVTVRILRADSPYRRERGRYAHRTVRTLSEVLSIIGQKTAD